MMVFVLGLLLFAMFMMFVSYVYVTVTTLYDPKDKVAWIYIITTFIIALAVYGAISIILIIQIGNLL